MTLIDSVVHAGVCLRLAPRYWQQAERDGLLLAALDTLEEGQGRHDDGGSDGSEQRSSSAARSLT